MDKDAPAAALGLRMPWPERGAQDWRLRTALQWLIGAAWPLTLVLVLHQPLHTFWQWTLSTWSRLLGLSDMGWRETGEAWRPLDPGALAPSSATLALSFGVILLIWLASGRLSDRFYPLKVTLRALCLIQLTASLYFWLSPASFPYTLSAHLNALLTMSHGFMLAIAPMLALGMGVLHLPWKHKLLAPLGVLTYFALMLPHKIMLHWWILERVSILFMPLLFWALGSLLDLWIFVALYGWLVSQAPPQAHPARGEQP